MTENVFLTTSHNQNKQLLRLIKSISPIYAENSKLIIVESGTNELIDNDFIKILEVDEDSFWGKSTAHGLDYIYKTFKNINLIILNCDVQLENWHKIKSLCEPSTFYTVKNGMITRSGYKIFNKALAIHKYPYLNQKFDQAKESSVDIIPTRLLFVPKKDYSLIKGIKPNFIKLPHYGSDFIFTYDLKNKLGRLLKISTLTFIIEDESTTGIKSKNSLIQRIQSINNIKSIYRFQDRINVSILLTRNEFLPVRISNLFFSLLKWFLQLFKFHR